MSSEEFGVGTKISEIQKAEFVLPGDIVKDDSGPCAVFTEQGSSASQVTAAKVMDVKTRLPGCSGQAADAISAYNQVKMEDAASLVKIPKSECPDIWIHLPKHKWPKSWSSMEHQSFLLNGICTVIPCRTGQVEKVLLKHGWRKVPN